MVDQPIDVGGWPEYKSEPTPTDSDGDGIPDEWEKKARNAEIVYLRNNHK